MSYRTSVTIIVDDKVRDNLVDFGLLDELEEYGLMIEKVDHDMGLIEGVIPTEKLHGLKAIQYISYVRETATYRCSLDESAEEEQSDAA